MKILAVEAQARLDSNAPAGMWYGSAMYPSVEPSTAMVEIVLL